MNMNGSINGWVSAVLSVFRSMVLASSTGKHGDVVFETPVHLRYPLLYLLRDLSSCQYKVLVDMTAVDLPSDRLRFKVVYHLLSVRYGTRCQVVTRIAEGDVVPSVVTRYHSSDWAERECYDMFGIEFDGHPDLRRILTDYGFEGHPMLKTYPLIGYTEVRYDESAKRVVTEPVQLAQDLRTYRVQMPWSGPMGQTVVGPSGRYLRSDSPGGGK